MHTSAEKILYIFTPHVYLQIKLAIGQQPKITVVTQGTHVEFIPRAIRITIKAVNKTKHY